MFGIHDFGLFLAAGFLLNLTPGPDTLYILGRSVAQGREAGVASAFGISLGSIFSHLRGRTRAFRDPGNVCASFCGHQVTRWGVSGFSWSEDDPESTSRTSSANQFSPSHHNRCVSTGCLNKCSQPQSRVVLPRVSSAIY